ncbi:DUF6894 family protein [Enterovirga sp. CN4-39]|uniref:DUF6894 family protein n=1 Tax=Enterovirga sp. CN4-39 TaxID=3400910 RepID=UPI003C0E8F85
MPRFYFDHRNGPDLVSDEEGIDCHDACQARDLAIRALGEVARERLSGPEHRELAIDVSDESRNPLFCAAVSFRLKIIG